MDDIQRTIVLLGHEPSEATQRFIASLPGEVVTYLYGLSVNPLSVQDDVITALWRINKDVNLTRFGRVLLVPPGSSTAAVLFVAGLRGITGTEPEVLYTPQNPNNGFNEPIKGKEILSAHLVYCVMRKKRPEGLLPKRERQGVLSVKGAEEAPVPLKREVSLPPTTTCIDCGGGFMRTKNQNQVEHPPDRCPSCRYKRKMKRKDGPNAQNSSRANPPHGPFSSPRAI